MTNWNSGTHGNSPASAPLGDGPPMPGAPRPAPPKPGPAPALGPPAVDRRSADSGQAVSDTELVQGEIERILASIEAGDGGQTAGVAELFESAHEVLLGALGTVDRA